MNFSNEEKGYKYFFTYMYVCISLYQYFKIKNLIKFMDKINLD